MRVSLYQVDAFADEVFAGNPAALHRPAHHEYKKQLRRTADYRLRWFTPTFEIDLCGHATLASAHVLWTELGYTKEPIVFASQSGPLTVRRVPAAVAAAAAAAAGSADETSGKDKIVLDFPSRPPAPIAERQHWPTDLLDALGIDATTPLSLLESRDLVVEFATAQQVLDLKPDFAAMGASQSMKKYVGVIVTAPAADLFDTDDRARAEGWDFVSRFFAPEVGVPEDPVTGSTHCSLVPFWAAKLGKDELAARQASGRGGTLWCTLQGDRVHIAGTAVTYLRGEIDV